MKLITRNVYGSLEIINIPDSSSIKTTKVGHIIETNKDGNDFKHEFRTIAVIIADNGAKIAEWIDGDWFYAG